MHTGSTRTRTGYDDGARGFRFRLTAGGTEVFTAVRFTPDKYTEPGPDQGGARTEGPGGAGLGPAAAGR
jgi:hypothetical protein